MYATNTLCFFALFFIFLNPAYTQLPTSPHSSLEKPELAFRNYDELAASEVLVVGTMHFDDTALTPENQQEIRTVVNQLANYKPTKLKINKSGDRLLIIVGDNHKWVLDMLLGHAPDFNIASSWELFKQ